MFGAGLQFGRSRGVEDRFYNLAKARRNRQNQDNLRQAQSDVTLAQSMASSVPQEPENRVVKQSIPVPLEPPVPSPVCNLQRFLEPITPSVLAQYPSKVEVLGAAACHLKIEQEDLSSVTYAVKDFESGEDYKVEWNETQLDICCSCHSFEFRGYLCRHAIVVLQMSGFFTIPFKYILQRWTNAAASRYPISDKLENVQANTRRLNDLCRWAIILGEEGSISEESYKIALSAIKHALLRCSNANNNAENELRPSTSTPVGICGTEEEDQVGATNPKDPVPNLNANKGIKRAKSTNDGTIITKEKVPSQAEVVNIGIDASFHRMELPNTRLLQLHNMMPPHLQGVVPTMFHNVASTQFHNVASAQLQNSRLRH